MISIAKVDQESQDLDLHVQLCAQRYAELDSRMTSLEIKVDSLGTKIDDNKALLIKAFIATGGSIIVSIVGLAGIILTKMP
jgi:hypothetical protein